MPSFLISKVDFSNHKKLRVLTAEQSSALVVLAWFGYAHHRSLALVPQQSCGVLNPLLRLRRELMKMLKRIFTLPLARHNKKPRHFGGLGATAAYFCPALQAEHLPFCITLKQCGQAVGGSSESGPGLGNPLGR